MNSLSVFLFIVIVVLVCRTSICTSFPEEDPPEHPKMFQTYHVVASQKTQYNSEDLTLYIDHVNGTYRADLITELYGLVAMYVYNDDPRYYMVVGPTKGPYLCMSKGDGQITPRVLDLIGSHAMFEYYEQIEVDGKMCNCYKNSTMLYLNDASDGTPVQDRDKQGVTLFKYSSFTEVVDPSKFIMPLDKGKCLPLSHDYDSIHQQQKPSHHFDLISSTLKNIIRFSKN